MARRVRSDLARGFNLMEVLVALIVLGIVSVIYMQMSRYSQKNTGKSIDWQAESVLLEKTIENLRIGHSCARLRALDSSWTDSTSSVKIDVVARGAAPDPSFCTIHCDSLAQITVKVKRRNFGDSLVITTDLFAEAP